MQDRLFKYAFSILGIIVMLIFAVAALSVANTYATSVNPAATRSFSVSAQGKTTAIPDVAEFTFTVLTEGGTNLQSLQQQNTDNMNKAIAYVKAQGVDSKDISTRSYNIQPRYQYSNCSTSGGKVCPPPEIVGYTVTQSAQVKVRDFSKVGNMLSGVVQNGANTVSDLSFTLDNPTQAQNDATAQAIQKAKTKAQTLAEAGGFTLGRLLSVQEGSPTPTPMPVYSQATGMGGGVGGASPSIEAGSQDITETVTLTYEIQ